VNAFESRNNTFGCPNKNTSIPNVLTTSQELFANSKLGFSLRTQPSSLRLLLFILNIAIPSIWTTWTDTQSYKTSPLADASSAVKILV
jgi:hypothetical protein